MQISCEACLHYSKKDCILKIIKHNNYGKIRVSHIAISSFSRLRIGHDRLS